MTNVIIQLKINTLRPIFLDTDEIKIKLKTNYLTYYGKTF